MTDLRKKHRLFYFFVRHIRWFRYLIYVAIPALLIAIGLILFSLSVRQTDPVAQAFLLNLSAGFIGSFFTFVIIGLFDYMRSRIHFFEFSDTYIISAPDTQDKIAEHYKKINAVMQQVERLSRIIDYDSNPTQSKEIIGCQQQLVDYCIEEVKGVIASYEHLTDSSKLMLDKAIEVGEKTAITSLMSYYKSCSEAYKNSQIHLEDYVEIRNNLIKKLTNIPG